MFNSRCILFRFYDDFDKTVQAAKKDMDGVKIRLKEDETDVICEKCGRNMVVKVGRYGKFLACPGYPAVSYTHLMAEVANVEKPAKLEGRTMLMFLAPKPVK